MYDRGPREAFLQYIWQYQYFNKQDLYTTSGETITIVSPGILNRNAGPDFYNSKLLIGNLEWHGCVEIHCNSSDWIRHQHSGNKAYNNVILHLVLHEDVKICNEEGGELPTLELRTRIDPKTEELYKSLISTTYKVPCQNFINSVDEIFITSMLERTVVERLYLKTSEITNLFTKYQKSWEETAYHWLAKSFGFKINSDPFSTLSCLLPYSILKKYTYSALQTEALLFGVSGFLDKENESEYFNLLKKEYSYLKAKHQLETICDESSWKFMRLRPANFPTIRLAQFSAFLHNQSSLADFILYEQYCNLRQRLSVQPHCFWQEHYHFNKKSSGRHNPAMGDSSIDNLIINAIIPLRFFYAVTYDNPDIKTSCIDLLKSIRAEKNYITQIYSSLRLKISSSFESQGYIQLYNHYCQRKQCFSCTIGFQVMQRALEE